MYLTKVAPSRFVLVSALLLLTSVLPAPSAAADRPSSRPNILMIFSDDQGFHDVGCYGSEIATPQLDQLAAEGIRFTQFYSASSICTPSRFGLLTGRYPHRSRDQLLGALMFLEAEDARRGLRSGEKTFVSMLQQAGYNTSLVGKWHLGHGQDEFWPTNHGFDSFFGHTGGCVDFFTLQYGNRPDWYRGKELAKTDGYATEVITAEARSVIRSNAQVDQPFFMLVAYNAPHFGKGWNDQTQSTENVMQPNPNDLARVDGIEDPLRRAFAAKVIGMDKGIGDLLSELKEQKLADNTLVIFMTDHGGDPKYGGSNLPLRGGKATLFEGGIRVPCIVRWPGVTPVGVTSDAVACTIDWHDTFAEMLAAKTDGETSDGASLLPLLKGAVPQRKRTLVWRTGSHHVLERKAWYAAREGDWKWVRPPEGNAMLFDLANDPGEQNDLSAAQPAIAKRLERIATED